MIDLYTPSGIGDIYWVLQKLARAANAAGERFRIHTPPGSDIKMSRGKFLEYIDCVESVAPDGLPYPELVKRAAAEGHYAALRPVMYCEANTWLEAGRRLETYLPAFPTEFILNWQIDVESQRRALMHLKPGEKNIVVYTSGIANNESKSTGTWSAADWVARVSELRADPELNLIWIGAQYDADILPSLHGFFDSVLIDLPAPVIVSLLRHCDGFVSYQSGLSCISVIESIPTLMLYFRKIAALTKTFNPPTSKDYHPVFFDEKPRFRAWVDALPLRHVLGRGEVKRDYTFYVNENIERTEADWLANGWIHDDQYESIKYLSGSLLEVGCGSGCLAQRLSNVEYVGVDQSAPLLDLARAKNPGKKFIVGDVRVLPVEHFDHVCAFGFLKHFSLAEHDAIFAALAVRARKTLTVEMPVRPVEYEDPEHPFPHTWASEKRIAANAAKAGFEIVATADNRSGEKIFHMVRR
jgi:SAM-dependent methyltransferase